jgi:hypothetical protein
VRVRGARISSVCLEPEGDPDTGACPAEPVADHPGRDSLAGREGGRGQTLQGTKHAVAQLGGEDRETRSTNGVDQVTGLHLGIRVGRFFERLGEGGAQLRVARLAPSLRSEHVPNHGDQERADVLRLNRPKRSRDAEQRDLSKVLRRIGPNMRREE